MARPYSSFSPVYPIANDSTTARDAAPGTCPACASAAISTTSRTPDASAYWRCSACGEVWNAGRREPARSAPVGRGRW